MSENVNTMKELMLFTKNFNTEFKNEILNFGKKLKDLNSEVGSLENRITNLDDIANNITVANNKHKIESNNEILKQILKNSTQEFMKNYQNLIQNEIGKLNLSIQNLANITQARNLKENKKKSNINESTEHQQTSPQENNKDKYKKTSAKKNKKANKKIKQNKKLRQNKEKVKTEEIKANTFANEDAFDDVNPNINSSSEKKST